MKNTTYISASAGSGKTNRLVNEMAGQIQKGIVRNGEVVEVRGDQVIATTFTKKAAAELQERTRKILEDKGMFDEASRLANAAIGTIHSVAFQMLSRFWYLAGVSADVRIMPEEDVRFYVNQSLASCVTEEDIAFFDKYRKFFDLTTTKDGNYLKVPDTKFWLEDLKAIVNTIHNFRVGDVESGEKESVRLVEEFYKNPYPNQDATSEYAKGVMERLEVGVRKCRRLAKAADDLAGMVAKAFSENVEEAKLRLLLASIIKRLSGSKSLDGSAVDDLAELLRIQRVLACSPEVLRLQKEYIHRIFALAEKWKNEYAAFKESRCLLDFNDLERKFYELLEIKDVEEEIRSNFKSLFVDEFQDCSPLQIRIFEKLGSMMESVTYVGDKKQSIYGFRGTDLSVVESVTNEFPEQLDVVDENGNMITTLKESWRSTKTLVNFTNQIFERAFEGEIAPELVRLEKADGGNGDADEKPEHWWFDVGNNDLFYKELALKVNSLIKERGLKAKDVAILFRKNNDCVEMASLLRGLGLPVNTQEDSKSKKDSSRSYSFMNALVSLLVNEKDAYSKAVVLLGSEPGHHIGDVLSDRIEDLRLSTQDGQARNRWDEEQVIKRLLALCEPIRRQSVAAAIDSLVTEFGVKEILSGIENPVSASLFVDGYLAAAKTYEDRCRLNGEGASLAGFLTYVSNYNVNGLPDENGVFVGTYHKSKGLQWHTVVCCSLDMDPNKIDVKQDIIGVGRFKDADGTIGVYVLPKTGFAQDVLAPDLKASVLANSVRQEKLAEAKRLMYVGLTRARTHLITAAKQDKVAWLDALTGSTSQARPFPFLSDDVMTVQPFKPAAENIGPRAPEASFKVLSTPAVRTLYKEKFVEPSAVVNEGLVANAQVRIVKRVSGRINVKSEGDFADYGTYFHQVLFGWRLGEDNTALIKSLARDFHLSDPLNEPDKISATVESFYSFMKNAYGDPMSLHRELPFREVRDGQVISGSMDLVYETKDGVVLVDYKTCPRPIEELTDRTSDFYAGKYAPQLDCYRHALETSGKTVVDTILFYPTSGVLVEIRDLGF